MLTLPRPTLFEVDYRYDYQNRLISREEFDGTETLVKTEQFAYDGNQVALKFTDGELTNSYTWGHQVDQLLADERLDWNDPESPESEVIYPLADHLNTNRDIAVYDSLTQTTAIANHIIFDTFGNLISQTNSTFTTDFRWTGRWFDTIISLQYNYHRWYDPRTAQFISEDWLGFAAGDSNIRRYVKNRVLSHFDPNGLYDRRFDDPVFRYKRFDAVGEPLNMSSYLVQSRYESWSMFQVILDEDIALATRLLAEDALTDNQRNNLAAALVAYRGNPAADSLQEKLKIFDYKEAEKDRRPGWAKRLDLKLTPGTISISKNFAFKPLPCGAAYQVGPVFQIDSFELLRAYFVEDINQLEGQGRFNHLLNNLYVGVFLGFGDKDGGQSVTLAPFQKPSAGVNYCFGASEGIAINGSISVDQNRKPGLEFGLGTPGWSEGYQFTGNAMSIIVWIWSRF